MRYAIRSEAWAALDRLGDDWTYDCEGENLGTINAVITAYILRPKTAEEKAKSQRNLADLFAADMDSRTPLFGGRS